MSQIPHREWLLPLGVLIGYAVLMATNPVRHALLDGARALQRYKRLWTIPAGLGLCYALFRAGVTVFFYTVLPIEQQPAFGWKFVWVMQERTAHLREAHTLVDWLGAVMVDPNLQFVRGAWLVGLESVAGLFNNVVTTFPFSAIAAVMLLVNWDNHHTTLRKALRKRMGGWGLVVHGAILACAVSAILAPAMFGPGLLYLNRVAPGLSILRWSAIIDWLSSMFAYLFGVGVQVYLILLVYTWLRGLNWTPVHLMDMAIRRFSFVVKWAAVVMVTSSVLIDLPRVFALLFKFDDYEFFNRTMAYTDHVARPLLAVLLICFSSMQITLTFHSETLRKAVEQHWQLVCRFWWQLAWFFGIAAIHLFGFALLDGWLLLGFGGETTSAGIVWSFVRPVLGAILAAWLLAAWVSLYKRFETGRVQTPDWIPF